MVAKKLPKKPAVLSGLKNILKKKFKPDKSRKSQKTSSQSSSSDDEDSFHGFTDTEIETASLKSDRSSIFSSGSRKSSQSVLNIHSKTGLGKRQPKPTLKVKENKASTPKKKTVSQDSDKPTTPKSASVDKALQKSAKQYTEAVSSGKENKSIEKIIKKSKTKQEKTPKSSKTTEVASKKVVLKESVLEVNKSEPAVFYQVDKSLLQKTQKSGNAKFSGKVQKFQRGSVLKFPSFLRDSEQNLVNIIGSALVDKNVEKKTKKYEGNIVCGCCGIITYCRDVRKNRSFKTFLCSHCSAFIQNQLKLGSSNNPDQQQCSKKCFIQPNSESNCDNCWLQLILSSCVLDEKIRSKLVPEDWDISPPEGRRHGSILECVG